jgi:hypothetical protein
VCLPILLSSFHSRLHQRDRADTDGVRDQVEATDGHVTAGKHAGHGVNAEPCRFGDLFGGHSFAYVCGFDFASERAIDGFLSSWH